MDGLVIQLYAQQLNIISPVESLQGAPAARAQLRRQVLEISLGKRLEANLKLLLCEWQFLENVCQYVILQSVQMKRQIKGRNAKFRLDSAFCNSS